MELLKLKMKEQQLEKFIANRDLSPQLLSATIGKLSVLKIKIEKMERGCNE